MDQNRLIRINELAIVLWDDDTEQWHPESKWPSLLTEHCAGDEQLAEDVATFVRASQTSPENMNLPIPIPFEPKTYSEPTNIGRYSIVRQIGSGGMGIVYEATFRAEDMEPRTVVVKVVKASALELERFTRRLRAERNLLSRLQHPNVVQILDAGTTPQGDPFFVMEHVEGALPIDRYAREKELNITERVVLFKNVCEAVGYVHEQGIVHRDLKPANILVSQSGIIKLVDFGLATLSSPQPDAPSFVNSEETPRRLGTRGFMSPQQARAEVPTPLDDVFTLGSTLKMLTAGVEPASEKDASLLRLVQIVASQCQRESSTDRFQSVDAIIKRLESPVLKDSSSASVISSRPAKRYRLLIAICLALMVGTALRYYYTRRVERARELADVQALIERRKDIERIASEFRPFAEQLWIQALQPLTKKRGAFKAQVGYTRQLVANGDLAAKAILARTLLFCRSSMIENGKEEKKETREQRVTKRKASIRNVVKLTEQEIRDSVDREIEAEESVYREIGNLCSEQSVIEGIGWLEEIARLGQSGSANLMASIYILGLYGLPKDSKRAFYWAQIAADGKHPESFHTLGELYIEGAAVPQNMELAADYWELAAKHGVMHAQYKLAYVFAYGLSKKRPKDKEAGYKWALLAAANPSSSVRSEYPKMGDLNQKLRAETIELRDKLERELTRQQINEAQSWARTWKPLPSQASVMKYSLAEHEAIRERVLGKPDPDFDTAR